MSGLVAVNPQVLDAVREANKAVIGPAAPIDASTSVAKRVGDGVAYQYVAQSCAIAVQDGENYMRNIMAMGEAAMAVVLTNMLQNPPASVGQWSQALGPIQEAVSQGVQAFAQAGAAAAKILSEFPAS